MNFHISAKELSKAVRALNQIIKPNYKDRGMEGDRFARISYNGYGVLRIYSGMLDHAAYIPLTDADASGDPWEVVVPRAYLTDTVKAIGSKGTVTVTDAGWEHDGFMYTYPEPWGQEHERAKDYFNGVDWGLSGEEIVLPVVALRYAVKRVAPAAGKDDTLPMLSGVLLQVETDGTVYVVATDRFRLHVDKVAITSTTLDPGTKVLIDGDALARLSKHLEGDYVVLHVRGASVLVTAIGLTAVLPTVNQDFVRWERLLESTGADVIRVPGNQLSETVKKLVTKKSNGKALNATPIRLRVDGDRMLVANPDIVAPVVTVESGIQWMTSINGRYLLDALECFDGGPDMWAYPMAPHKPILFTGPNDFQALVMPRRVPNEQAATYWDDMM